MHDTAVTLTDYLLTLECLVFVGLLRRAPRASRTPAEVFFVALAVASAAGGTVHGYFPEVAQLGHQVLWRLTLLSLGVASFGLFGVSLTVLKSPSWALRTITALTIAYSAYVLADLRPFLVGILFYVPALLLLAGVCAFQYVKYRRQGAKCGFFGVLMTFLASGLQQAHVGLHPTYLNHNALYHLLEALALFFFFRCFKAFSEKPAQAT